MCAQGLKRAQVALEKAEARAAKKAATDERDPRLPKSVPLPKDVSDVQNQHVATLLAEGVLAAVGTAPEATGAVPRGAAVFAAVAARAPGSDDENNE